MEPRTLYPYLSIIPPTSPFQLLQSLTSGAIPGHSSEEGHRMIRMNSKRGTNNKSSSAHSAVGTKMPLCESFTLSMQVNATHLPDLHSYLLMYDVLAHPFIDNLAKSFDED